VDLERHEAQAARQPEDRPLRQRTEAEVHAAVLEQIAQRTRPAVAGAPVWEGRRVGHAARHRAGNRQAAKRYQHSSPIVTFCPIGCSS
jgi:hypothetical protein